MYICRLTPLGSQLCGLKNGHFGTEFTDHCGKVVNFGGQNKSKSLNWDKNAWLLLGGGRCGVEAVTRGFTVGD